MVSKISFSKEAIDCIVFWTKDPSKILKKIDKLNSYVKNYYFQITVNGYPKEIEKNVPPLETAINSFIDLSKKIGKEKVIWRYDPIILSDEFDAAYHIEKFNEIAEKLNRYTKRCVISFLDIYSRTAENLSHVNYKDISESDMRDIGKKISESIKENKYNFEVYTCSEKVNLEEYGIKNGKCIDDKLISEIFNIDISDKKDKSQREECGCVKSRDIGAYNTCGNGCLYCYANFNDALRAKNIELHDPDSPLIFGVIDESKDRIVNKAKVQKSQAITNKEKSLNSASKLFEIED